MILVDINVLLYAVDQGSVHHTKVNAWLTTLFNNSDGAAFCWPVIAGFVRIATNAKALSNPLTLDEACEQVEEWLALPGNQLINAGANHWQLFSGIMKQCQAKGNLVSDAHLAAIAMEHNLELASGDVDFAKFPGLRWINPTTM